MTNTFTADTTAVASEVNQNFTDVLTALNAFDAGNLSSGTIPLARISGLTVTQLAAATIVLEAEGIANNDNDTTWPTCAAVKDYADSASGQSDINKATSHVDLTTSYQTICTVSFTLSATKDVLILGQFAHSGTGGAQTTIGAVFIDSTEKATVNLVAGPSDRRQLVVNHLEKSLAAASYTITLKAKATDTSPNVDGNVSASSLIVVELPSAS